MCVCVYINIYIYIYMYINIIQCTINLKLTQYYINQLYLKFLEKF